LPPAKKPRALPSGDQKTPPGRHFVFMPWTAQVYLRSFREPTWPLERTQLAQILVLGEVTTEWETVQGGPFRSPLDGVPPWCARGGSDRRTDDCE